MTKVIYICSLPHSGSTLLALLLGAHSNALALGEIASVLGGKQSSQEGTKEACSCGKDMATCDVWRHYVPPANSGDVYSEKYRSILALAQQQECKVIVDSSKKAKKLIELKPLADRGEIDLRVVFLVRDPRGWTRSIRRMYKQHNRWRPVPYVLHMWYKQHTAQRATLQVSGVPWHGVTYTDLCTNTNDVMNRLYGWLDLPAEDVTSETRLGSHIAYSNRMKLSIQTAGDIRHDVAWQQEKGICQWYTLLPHVRKAYEQCF